MARTIGAVTLTILLMSCAAPDRHRAITDLSFNTEQGAPRSPVASSAQRDASPPRPHQTERVETYSVVVNSRCEALFLALAALSPPKTQYATPIMREESRLRCIRRYLFGAGGIAMAASLLTAVTLHLKIHDIKTTIEQDQREVALARTRLEALQGSLPAVPVGDAQIQSLIVRHHRLYPQTGGPAQLFQLISHALAGTPTIEIERIEWTLENDKQARDKDMTSAMQGHRETAVIHGHVQPAQEAHLQTEAAQLRRFVAALKETSQVSARTTRPNGDEPPAHVSHTGISAQIKAHPFIIELAWNRNP